MGSHQTAACRGEAYIRSCFLIGNGFYWYSIVAPERNSYSLQESEHRRTGLLENEGIKVSMDGRGRVYDNIFIERLWRSVKYEEVYLHDYQTVPAARSHLSDYFEFYNNERPHEALGYRTPHEVYFGTKARLAPASEAVV